MTRGAGHPWERGPCCLSLLSPRTLQAATEGQCSARHRQRFLWDQKKKKNHFLNGLFSPTLDPENVLRAQVPQLLHWNQPPPVAWPVCSPHRLPSSVHWVPSDLGRRLVCPLTFKTRDGDEIHNKLKPCPFSLRGLPVTHEEEHPHVPRRPLTAGETRTECVCVRVRALPLELTARAATQTGTHQLP